MIMARFSNSNTPLQYSGVSMSFHMQLDPPGGSTRRLIDSKGAYVGDGVMARQAILQQTAVPLRK